jgi:hypothetical protein
MEHSELSAPPSYVKHAFAEQHNLILLFGAAAFSLAFASPLPLLLAAGGELAWLALGPRLPAFRSAVDRRLEAQRQAKADQALETASGPLSASHSNRFLVLTRSADEALTLARARSDMPPEEQRRAVQALLKVRRTFLDYQLLSQRVTALVNATPAAAVEQEAARLQQSYAADRDLTVRMTIRKALTQNERQQQQIQQLTSLSRAIELRLSMIEQALSYVRGQAADAASGLLARELDSLLTQVGSAERLEAAINDVFSGPSPASAAGNSGTT